MAPLRGVSGEGKFIHPAQAMHLRQDLAAHREKLGKIMLSQMMDLTTSHQDINIHLQELGKSTLSQMDLSAPGKGLGKILSQTGIEVPRTIAKEYLNAKIKESTQNIVSLIGSLVKQGADAKVIQSQIQSEIQAAVQKMIPAAPKITIPAIPGATPAQPKQIGVNVDKAKLFNQHPYLRLIPEDAFVKRDVSGKVKARMDEVGVALIGLAKRKLIKVPARIWNDLKMLTDPAKRTTVRDAYLSLASIYAYLYGFRIVGAVAVVGIPHRDVISMIFNTLAAGWLLWGEGGSRIPGSVGFQHVILRALSRGPEYYEVSEDEKKLAAGMHFDPNKNKPFETYEESKKCTTVLYIRDEEHYLLRGLFGHFNIENKRQTMIVEVGSTKRKEEFEKNIKKVEEWIKGMLDSVVAARKHMMEKTTTVAEATADLRKVLEGIKASYENKGNVYLCISRNKTRRRMQGREAALDEYQGKQFLKHAEVWQQRIDALDKKSRELVGEAEMRAYLGSFYEYLEHKFTYKIILNFRTYKTVDIDLYKSMLADITKNLINLGIKKMDEPVTRDTLEKIVKAVEDENARVKRNLSGYPDKEIKVIGPIERISGRANKIDRNKNIAGDVQNMLLSGMKTKDVLENIIRNYDLVGQNKQDKMFEAVSKNLKKDGFKMDAPATRDVLKEIIKSITKEDGAAGGILGMFLSGAKTSDVLAHILMEQLSRDPYRGGIKAGVRSDVYHRLGKTFVRTNTMFGSEIDMRAEEWDAKAKSIGSFKENVRIAWPDADNIGSYDKDYVPLSIDLLTGEYVDIFRYNIPMFKKWSKKEGRTNISISQNLQINANYQKEGPLDKNGNRMFFEEPFELVAGICGADQDLWYGAFKLSKALVGLLKKHFGKEKSGHDFLRAAAKRVLTSFGGLRGRKEAKKLIAKITSEMGSRLDRAIDRTTGNEIIEWIQKYARDKVIATGILPGRGEFGGVFSCGTCEDEDRVGMMRGYNRPYVQTVDGRTLAQVDIRFNPETKRMEIYNYENRYSRSGTYGAEESFFKERLNQHEMSNEEIDHIKQKYSDDNHEVKVIDGRIHIINKQTTLLEKVIWWYDQSPDFVPIKEMYREKEWKHYVSSDGKGVTVENKKSAREKFTYYPANLTIEQIKDMNTYKGWRITEFSDRIEGVNPKDGKQKFTYCFKPDISWDGFFKNCRKVEIDYAKYEDTNERTVIRDYAPDGSCYETKLIRGTVKKETIYATQKNVQDVVNSLYATREIEGDVKPRVNPNDPDEVIIEIDTMLPEIKTTFHNGLFSEVVQTPPVYQPDKWITEDMATTYWQLFFNGVETEIMPVEVGRAVGPAYIKELLTMWRRWFKGGPEVDWDVREELRANGIKVAIDGIPIIPRIFSVARSPVGWMRNLAKNWPWHTVTDIALYVIPPAFLAGLYASEFIPGFLPHGLEPLVSPESYIGVFLAYLVLTLRSYVSPMRKLGYSGFPDVFNKEAMLKVAATVYVDAWRMAKHRWPLTWDATEAGDRDMVPLKYLKGIARRRFWSELTAVGGFAATALCMAKLGVNNIPGILGFVGGFLLNWGFPAVNTVLIETGINRFFGFWTSFDDLMAYHCQLAGVERKKIEVAGEKKSTIEVKEVRDSNLSLIPDVREVTFYAKSEGQAKKAVRRMTGKTAFSYLARAANGTLGRVMKIVRGWRRDDNIRFREHFAQFNEDSKNQYAEWLRKRKVTRLPGDVREKYITYLEINGILKRVNNVILNVNDAANLIGEPQSNYDPATHLWKTTLQVKINPKAENFKYESFYKNTWIPGNIYFSGDMKIQKRLEKEKKRREG